MSEHDHAIDGHAIAHRFIAGLVAGELGDDLLTDDMTGWLTTQGTVSKAQYQAALRWLDSVCVRPLDYTVHAITAEADRVVIEASSTGELIDGAPYANTYVFVMRLRDRRIAAVAEHYNALVAQDRLMPLMTRSAEG